MNITLQPPTSLIHISTPKTGRSHLNELRQDMLGYLEFAAAQGDFLKIPVPLGHLYFLNHPDLIQEVLIKQARSFHKAFTLKYTGRQFFGENLFTSDGEVWRKLRSVIQPGFSLASLSHYADIIMADTERMIRFWPSEHHLDMVHVFSELTLRSTTQCFFGEDLYSTTAGENLIHFIELFFVKISSLPIPGCLPTPSNRELKRLLREIDHYLQPMIEKRRQSGHDRQDILSMLLKAQAADTTVIMTDLKSSMK